MASNDVSSPQGQQSPALQPGPEGIPDQGLPISAPAQQPAPALREDQIANAVAFLTHPKVTGSPVATKKSFLERKGLTAAEIDEAFRRVPEPAATTVATVSAPAGATVSTTATLPQSSATNSQHHAGLVSYLPQPQQQQAVTYPAQQQVGVPYPPSAQAQQMAMVPAKPAQPEPIRWTQVALGVGAVVAGVYAVKTFVVPYAQDLYSRWSQSSKQRHEQQEVREREVLAAVEVLKDCQLQLRTSTETLQEVAKLMREQVRGAAGPQLGEFGADASAFQSLGAGPSARHGINGYASPGDYLSPGGRTTSALPAPRGYGGPASGHRPAAADDMRSEYYEGGPRSYGMEERRPPSAAGRYAGGGSAVQQGNLYNYEERRAGAGSGYVLPPFGSGASGQQQQQALGADRRPGRQGEEPSYPPSFHEVMEMVSKGITPPNVRTDIIDQPPDPTRPPSEARLKPRPKPWERDGQQPSSASSSVVDVPISITDSGLYPQTTAATAFQPPAAAAAHAMQPGRGAPHGTAGFPTGGSPDVQQFPQQQSPVQRVHSNSSFAASDTSMHQAGVEPAGAAMQAPHQQQQQQPLSTMASVTAGWRPPAPPEPTYTKPRTFADMAAAPAASPSADGGPVSDAQASSAAESAGSVPAAGGAAVDAGGAGGAAVDAAGPEVSEAP